MTGNGSEPRGADRVAWTCTVCGSARPASDDFCGMCGASAPRGPVAQVTEAAPDTAPRSATTPLVRMAALGGVLLVAVIVAEVVGGGSKAGPGTITVEPPTWRCDGSERAWTATIPASAPELVVELRSGGADGPVVVATPVARDSLEPYRRADGTYRVASKDPGAPECEQPAGRYALVLRDVSTGGTVASGGLTLEP